MTGHTADTMWDGDLWKGVANDFDEETEVLRSPCFAATSRDEAAYYAANLRTDDDGLRRVLELRPVRRLRLVLMNDAGDGQRLLQEHGIERSSPARMAIDVRKIGFDGLALDGGTSGFHLVLNDGALLRHVQTHAPQLPAPAP